MRTAERRFDAMVSVQSASEIASEFGRTSFAAAALLTRMSSPRRALMAFGQNIHGARL
jgi:hypothetical protein